MNKLNTLDEFKTLDELNSLHELESVVESLNEKDKKKQDDEFIENCDLQKTEKKDLLLEINFQLYLSHNNHSKNNKSINEIKTNDSKERPCL